MIAQENEQKICIGPFCWCADSEKECNCGTGDPQDIQCKYCGEPLAVIDLDTGDLPTRINRTVRALCALDPFIPTKLERLCVLMGYTLPMSKTELENLITTLESFEHLELVVLSRKGKDITAARLTPLGAERAEEARRADTCELSTSTLQP